MSPPPKLVLASGSPRRLQLLDQIGVEPNRVLPVTVDETPKKNELPRNLAKRLGREKAEAAAAILKSEGGFDGALVLAADTVVGLGRRCLPKAELIDEATTCLRLLSGRAHRVYTGLCLVTAKGALRQRVVETRVRFKRLSRQDVEAYLASGEWRGKAGGYAVQGFAGAFVVKLSGSYPNVVGLPLHETMALLVGEGYPVHFNWLSAG
jgi:nucleoside triphosphate pyrophosphatase